MDPAHSRAHQRLWTDLTRHAQPGYIAAPAPLVAFTAWQNVALRSRSDARPWRPVPPGSAESAFRVTDSHADPAAFSVVELASMVSPYARPDYVTSTVYDHTSILKLVQQKWNLPSLTRRNGAAASPLEALDLEGEPAFLTPPELPKPSLAWGSR